MVIFILMFASLSIMVGALSIALLFACRSQWMGVWPSGSPVLREVQSNTIPRRHDRTVAWSDKDRDGFIEVWYSVCRRFNNDPRTAVCYADLLVSDIVGDPVWGRHDTELTLAGETREKYQRAHEIARRNSREHSNPAELALAMNLYLAVFAEVISPQDQSYRMDN